MMMVMMCYAVIVCLMLLVDHVDCYRIGTSAAIPMKHHQIYKLATGTSNREYDSSVSLLSNTRLFSSETSTNDNSADGSKEASSSTKGFGKKKAVTVESEVVR